MAWLDPLIAPFQYPFMQRGLVAAVLVGVVCAVIGAYVVLRGIAFLGDALAHSILPGIAAGFLTAGRGDRRALFWWALGTGIAVAIGIGWIAQRTRVREDAAIGIVFAGMFALGIAMISTVRGFAVDLVHFLFGNILGVTAWDLWVIAALGGLVLLIVLAFYKELLVVSFDPTLASTLRLPTSFYQYLLLVLVAIAVVTSLRTVGVGLMLAMLVTPASTGYLLTRRLPAMMAVGAAVGALSGVTGLYLSYYTGISSGAAIVLVAVAFFLAAALFAPRRGILRRRRTRIADRQGTTADRRGPA